MATITDNDFTWIKNWVKSRPEIWNEFKIWGIDKSTFLSGFQACENYMINAFGTTPTTSVRTAIENAVGATTALRAQYVFITWVNWKLKNYLDGV